MDRDSKNDAIDFFKTTRKFSFISDSSEENYMEVRMLNMLKTHYKTLNHKKH